MRCLPRFAAAFLMLHSAAAPAAAQDRADERAFVDNLSCTVMEWVAGEGVANPERGALRVPVRLDGEDYWFQLDTGAGNTILYGDGARRRGWAPAEAEGNQLVRVPNIELGGARKTAHRVFEMRNMVPGATQGTVGLDLLLGHVVVLDFVHGRFCLVTHEDLPPNIHPAISFTPGEIRNAKFFVRVSVNGDELDGIFFDSGASVFPLTLDLSMWTALTGRSAGDPGNERYLVWSWGRQVPMIGAPAHGALEIGGVRLDRPMVYHWGDRPRFFADWNFSPPVTGSLGNVPVWDDLVVLDLGINPRMGIFKNTDRRLSELEQEAASGDPARALNLALELLRLDPARSVLLRVMASLEQVVDHESPDPRARYQIGRIAALTGMNLDSGQAALEDYLQSPPPAGAPGHAAAHWRLGMIHERRGDLERARAAYREALTLEPEHHEAARALESIESKERPMLDDPPAKPNLPEIR